MESYVVPKKASFRDLENSFKVIESNKNLEIRLPNSLSLNGVFGLEGLVCLLIATWIRNSEGVRVFHSYENELDPDKFDDLGSSFYGICALRLSDKILSSGRVEIEKTEALQMAFDRGRKVVSGNFRNAYKGLYLAIPSIKTAGKNREYNSPFYNENEVSGKNRFRIVTKSAIDSVVPQSSRNSFVSQYEESISEIIRELFDNTHKHARINENGDVLEKNFRGVIFSSVDINKSRLEELVSDGVEGMVALTAEWNKWIEDNGRQMPVLDITVVDAGPGFARRWTGKSKNNISDNEEVEAILSCFTKNNSTSPNAADGSGLTHVLTDLRKVRGWFRLRTGSMSVSKSFFDGLGDVRLEASNVKKAGSFIEGASFNVVIPLVDISKGGF